MNGEFLSTHFDAPQVDHLSAVLFSLFLINTTNYALRNLRRLVFTDSISSTFFFGSRVKA